MSVNNIPKDFYIKKEKQHRYQVTVSDIDTQEVMYINDSFAGLLCTMEEVTGFDGLSVEGKHQFMAWGNPMLQVYCYDQTRLEMKKKLPLLIAELEKMGVFKQATIDDLNNWIKNNETK